MFNEERNCYVYELTCLETGEVFYIGRGTEQGSAQFHRWYKHQLKAKQGCDYPVYRKMRKLSSEGKTVKFLVVGTGLTRAESVEMEKRLIISFGLDNLTNILSCEGEGATFKHYEKTTVDLRSTRSRTDKELECLQIARDKIKRKVWVKDVQTGKVFQFDSIKECSRAFLVEPKSIKYSDATGSVWKQCYKFSFTSFEVYAN